MKNVMFPNGNFIGIEFNQEYIDVVKSRVEEMEQNKHELHRRFEKDKCCVDFNITKEVKGKQIYFC